MKNILYIVFYLILIVYHHEKVIIPIFNKLNEDARATADWCSQFSRGISHGVRQNS